MHLVIEHGNYSNLHEHKRKRFKYAKKKCTNGLKYTIDATKKKKKKPNENGAKSTDTVDNHKNQIKSMFCNSNV